MARFLQLAPMQGLTDVVFMNAYHQIFGGFTEYMAPYIQADSNSPTKLNALRKTYAGLRPGIKLVPQLLSNDAKGIVYFCNALYDLGYPKVNLNLGCPYPVVANKHRGSGLLKFPQTIEALLAEALPHIKPQFSVKMRLGYTHKTEVYELARVMNQFNLNEVIVHARTAVQLYEGQADADFFVSVFNQFNAPLVYNGDIVSVKQVVALEQQTPNIKGFMIGRGAFTNPFITLQLNNMALTNPQKRELFRNFYELLAQAHQQQLSPLAYLGRMKQLWKYFACVFMDAQEPATLLYKENNVAVFNALAETIMRQNERAV